MLHCTRYYSVNINEYVKYAEDEKTAIDRYEGTFQKTRNHRLILALRLIIIISVRYLDVGNPKFSAN